MTLTEFLRARVADDEAFYRVYDIEEEHRRRVLAECEAKRRIIEEYQQVDALPADMRVDQRVTFRFVLEHLATPYAAHPDYDNRWRPYGLDDDRE